MLRRTGFTLIELLIVVTILAILAGAAIPYVQDYVEDARVAKAKDDISIIKNALALYETKRGETYQTGNVQALVNTGFLTAVPADPWGAPYVIATAQGEVKSLGPDGTSQTTGGDDVRGTYQPPLAITSAYWIDTNGDGLASGQDTIELRFTRPVAGIVVTQAGNAGSNFTLLPAGSVSGLAAFSAAAADASYSYKLATYTMPNNMSITPGKTTVMGNFSLLDWAGNHLTSSCSVKILSKY